MKDIYYFSNDVLAVYYLLKDGRPTYVACWKIEDKKK